MGNEIISFKTIGHYPSHKVYYITFKAKRFNNESAHRCGLWVTSTLGIVVRRSSAFLQPNGSKFGTKCQTNPIPHVICAILGRTMENCYIQCAYKIK